MAVTKVAREAVWSKAFRGELHMGMKIDKVPLMIDNKSASTFTKNPECQTDKAYQPPLPHH